ncbi:MAG TPA: dihydrolipoamide acetyltransferase family protein [Thermoplasmata archaeon]|nr:dihydrolipoamide acetyltransferase family protein [Thermoplasmata archaeon]HTW77397.1 dihydrolipoamide acetyltransferase family protein [Thermoplasmata archaeon]
MRFEFRLPDIGEGVAEGEVVQWFVKEGDTVREDAPLVSVLTDKANVEIPSPKTGRVAQLHAPVGTKVKVGGLLVTLEVEGPGSGPAAAATPAMSAAPSAEKSPAVPPPTAPRPPAPAAAGPAAPAAAPLAAPYVRRLAAERGIDLAGVRGSGPNGRITEADLGGSPTSAAPATPPPGPLGRGTSPPPVGTATTAPETADVAERIPIRGIRRVIAEHMTESTHRAAHFTYVEEVDVSELVRVRDRMAKHVEKQGVRLSYLPFVVKGVVAGLKAHPHLNATVDDAREELVVRSAYHLGIATQTGDGLLVPVLRDADQKSLAQIAKAIQDLSERGRAGKLALAELKGSTFTISSLGALGGVMATPILNYPEVGILGVHRIFRRPVYQSDGAIGPADLMNLSISLDHRVVDGYEGAQFLATVKGYLEDPHQLFAELT